MTHASSTTGQAIWIDADNGYYIQAIKNDSGYMVSLHTIQMQLERRPCPADRERLRPLEKKPTLAPLNQLAPDIVIAGAKELYAYITSVMRRPARDIPTLSRFDAPILPPTLTCRDFAHKNGVKVKPYNNYVRTYFVDHVIA